ncbi:uncharacterized protein [Nicotiana tomentosiformis]|uniref:uncharacterized protein n=1 Tax=Nicotiana tomentosiformis TaxID=4098 RepID=UPI00388C47EE
MAKMSSAWKSRANILQGDPNMIHLHKELQDHGQAIAELTTTMTQLAKAQLNQVQNSKKVNAMEGVNKRRIKGPQVQNRVENYVQEDSGFDQYDSYNEQEEERALPSDTIVNPKGGNYTGHAMAATTRSRRGGNSPTSSQRQLMDDEQEVQEEEISSNEVKPNDEVRIDIDDSVEETQEESLSINVPLVEALEKIPGYAMFMKDLMTKKRSMNIETIKVIHQVSAIMHSIAPKLKDAGAFTIPCTIGSAEFAKALCDLGASINLMPYSVFKTLGLSNQDPPL